MSRVLLLVNTHSQLFIGVFLKLTLYTNDVIDVIISDQISRYSDIAKQLEETKLFDKVFAIRTQEATYSQNKWRDVIDLFTVNFLNKADYQNSGIKINKIYDQFLFFNFSMPVYVIFDICMKRNRELKCLLIEEGILSYAHIGKFEGFRTNLTEKFRGKIGKFINKRSLYDYVSAIYCCNEYACKELMNYRNIDILKIPRKEKVVKRAINILNSIYNFKNLELRIDKKFIYLGSYLSELQDQMTEYKLIREISQKVGKENLLLKLHPRMEKDKYEHLGIEISTESSLPWEIIQMNISSGKEVCVISLASGSVLNAETLFGNGVKGFFIFPCAEWKDETVHRQIEAITEILPYLKEKDICNNVMMVDNLDDILFN